MSTRTTRLDVRVTSLALFMVTLDNLVVTTALPVIRDELDGSLEGLEWTVNAYTLTFAVLLLTGRGARRPVRAPAALLDRPRRSSRRLGGGRPRPDSSGSPRARALQGLGGAIVTPLTLTILQRRCRRRGAGSPSAPGAASAASRSRWARSWAARSSRASRGSGSSGSTCRSASSSRRSRPAAASRATARPGGSTCRASRS